MATSNIERYDNIILGGGWSAVECANALNEAGRSSLMVTADIDSIGWIAQPALVKNRKVEAELKCQNALIMKILGSAKKDTRLIARLTKKEIDKKENILLRQDTITKIKKEKEFTLSGKSGQVYLTKHLFLFPGNYVGANLSQKGPKASELGLFSEITENDLEDSLNKLGLEMTRSQEKQHKTLKPGTLKDGLLAGQGLHFGGKFIGAENAFESALTGIIAARWHLKDRKGALSSQEMFHVKQWPERCEQA